MCLSLYILPYVRTQVPPILEDTIWRKFDLRDPTTIVPSQVQTPGVLDPPNPH